MRPGGGEELPLQSENQAKASKWEREINGITCLKCHNASERVPLSRSPFLALAFMTSTTLETSVTTFIAVSVSVAEEGKKVQSSPYLSRSVMFEYSRLTLASATCRKLHSKILIPTGDVKFAGFHDFVQCL